MCLRQEKIDESEYALFQIKYFIGLIKFCFFQATLVVGGIHSILRETIVPAVLAVVPQPLQGLPGQNGPPGPPGQNGDISANELQKNLAPITDALANLTTLTNNLATQMALIEAKLNNIHTRGLNRRLLPTDQWIPLVREVPQQIINGVPVGAAPGALPPAGSLPVRGVADAAAMGNAALQVLSNHYGIVFLSWTAQENYLQM